MGTRVPGLSRANPDPRSWGPLAHLSSHPAGREIERVTRKTMKSSLKQFLLLLLAVGFMALVGTGCQTTEGFGRDVEDLGEEIQGN